MGRKVHPVGFRLKVIKDWDARWYAEGERYADLLHEDLAIRERIRDLGPSAAVSRASRSSRSTEESASIRPPHQ